MEALVKFRIKGTRIMDTEKPLQWAIKIDDVDYETVATALSNDERFKVGGDYYPPENFVIEEIRLI